MNSAAGFFSWAGILTAPGATAACLLITRLLHQCFPAQLETVPEVAVAYSVATLLLLLATMALSRSISVWDYIIIPLNSAIVATTVVGGNILFGITSPVPRQEPTKAHPVETSERGLERGE